MIEQIVNQIRVLGSNGNVKRSHPFIGFRVHGITGHCPGDAPGIADSSVHLGIYVGSMLEHEIEKLGIGGAASTAARVVIRRTRNTGGI